MTNKFLSEELREWLDVSRREFMQRISLGAASAAVAGSVLAKSVSADELRDHVQVADTGKKVKVGIGLNYGPFAIRFCSLTSFSLVLLNSQFRESALPSKQTLVAAPHTVAGLESFDGCPHRFYHARQVTTHDEWQRQVHFHQTAPHVSIDGIHRHRACSHEHL